VLHACTTRFNVTRNFEKFLNFGVNKAAENANSKMSRSDLPTVKQYQEYDAEHRIQNAGCRDQHRTDELQATKDRCVAQARAMSKVQLQSSSKPSTTHVVILAVRQCPPLVPCRHSPGTHVPCQKARRRPDPRKRRCRSLGKETYRYRCDTAGVSPPVKTAKTRQRKTLVKQRFE